jgi:hypothetical protein
LKKPLLLRDFSLTFCEVMVGYITTKKIQIKKSLFLMYSVKFSNSISKDWMYLIYLLVFIIKLMKVLLLEINNSVIVHYKKITAPFFLNFFFLKQASVLLQIYILPFSTILLKILDHNLWYIPLFLVKTIWKNCFESFRYNENNKVYQDFVISKNRSSQVKQYIRFRFAYTVF